MASTVGHFFRNILRSFDARSYPEFFRQKASSGLWYLAGMLALVHLSWVPAAARAHYLSSEELIRLYESNLADVRFADGHAHLDGTAGVVRRDRAGRNAWVTFVVDASGDTDHEAVGYRNPIVVTRDRLWRKTSKGWESQEVPKTTGEVSAGAHLAEAVRSARWSSFVVSLVLGFVWVFVQGYVILASFAFAVAAAIYGVARFALKREEPLPNLFVIVAFALTPLLLGVAFVGAVSPPEPIAYGVLVLGLGLFVCLAAVGTRRAFSEGPGKAS